MSHLPGCQCALCRITTRTSSPEPLVKPLTVIECAVLTLIAEGQSNKTIGKSLNRSPSTVGEHLKACFKKLGVHDRAHAIAKCFRLGILT